MCEICKSTIGVTKYGMEKDGRYYQYPSCCALGCTIRCKHCNFDNIDIISEAVLYCNKYATDITEYFWRFQIKCGKCCELLEHNMEETIDESIDESIDEWCDVSSDRNDSNDSNDW
jgi:hypothetical protein